MVIMSQVWSNSYYRIIGLSYQVSGSHQNVFTTSLIESLDLANLKASGRGRVDFRVRVRVRVRGRYRVKLICSVDLAKVKAGKLASEHANPSTITTRRTDHRFHTLQSFVSCLILPLICPLATHRYRTTPYCTLPYLISARRMHTHALHQPKLLTLTDFPNGVKFHHDKPFMRGMREKIEFPYNFHM